MTACTIAELTCVAASHQIVDGETVFVGVGKPVIAAFLAKLTHAPNITILFETGIVRTRACELPMLLDTLATQADADKLDNAAYVTSLAARGLVHLGLVGAGQVDRRGNINSVAAGDYRAPVVRWPGGGGANDIVSLCGRTVVLLDQKRERLPERVDFVTAPGYLEGGNRAAGLPSGGASAVITDLAVFAFAHGEAVLDSRHPGVAAGRVAAATGWDVGDASQLPETAAPTAEEVQLLREIIDPHFRVLPNPESVPSIPSQGTRQ